MEFRIETLLLLALFIEAVVQIFKPLWQKETDKLSPTEWISMFIGAAFAMVAKINMLEGLVPIDQPILLYVLYAFTGVAIGRGPSFVHDLWEKLKEKAGQVSLFK